MLIVVSGPSGVGKGTILKRVVAELPQLQIGSSWTTREPRQGDEREVKRYKYVTRDEFMRAVDKGELLEWAEFSGNLYGSWCQGDQHTLLEIEIQGALQVAQVKPEAVLIGILPPGGDLTQQLAVVEDRLRKRGNEALGSICRRLEVASGEITTIASIWPNIIINDDVERASKELIEMIQPNLLHPCA